MEQPCYVCAGPEPVCGPVMRCLFPLDFLRKSRGTPLECRNEKQVEPACGLQVRGAAGEIW